MSSADDLLFAPIDGSDEPWRAETRKLVQFLKEMKERTRPKRPEGALTLEELMECYYERDQHTFWVVDGADGKWDFEFNGEVYVDDAGYAGLSAPDGDPVIEWNLFPSDNSDAFVFASEDYATKYEDELISDDD
jgi:hypothetical protein